MRSRRYYATRAPKRPVVSRRSLVPQKCPSQEEISDALLVLSKQEMSVYQTLYREWLADPYGRPLHVRRSDAAACIDVYTKYFDGEQEQEISFRVTKPEAEEGGLDVIAKARLVVEAVDSGKKKSDSRMCCPLAEYRPCVCEVSFTCPLHGTHCIGSHD